MVAIRKAMNRHRTDADIAQYGLQALDRLARGADEGAQEVGSEFVAAVGLIGPDRSSGLPNRAWLKLIMFAHCHFSDDLGIHCDRPQ